VQQWYGDAGFSGFDFDYGGMTGASSSHPPPFDFPPPVNPQNVEESEDDNKSEASRRPPQHFLVLNDKGGEISIKA
jgi:hypothetical protein